MVKNPPARTEDVGSILGSGRYPGEGNGNRLQYSCLGNPMEGGAWPDTVFGVTKSAQLSVHAHTHTHGPWSLRESDTNEQLSVHAHTHTHTHTVHGVQRVRQEQLSVRARAHTHTHTQGINEARSENGVQIFTPELTVASLCHGTKHCIFFARTFLSL